METPSDNNSSADPVQESATPSVEPIDWDHLHPKICAGLVLAQSLATTVETRGKNEKQGYRYAQAPDVACRARECLKKAGMALVSIGWTIETVQVVAPRYGQGRGAVVFESREGVTVRFPSRLIHKDGPVGPEIWASITGVYEMGRSPDKLVFALLTQGRKYVFAQLLNMGWALSPAEDMDSDDAPDTKPGTPGPPPSPPMVTSCTVTKVQESPEPTPDKSDPQSPPIVTTRMIKEAVSPVNSGIREGAIQAFRIIVESGIDRNMVFQFVTGLTEPMPDTLTRQQMIGMIAAGMSVTAQIERGEAAPVNHFKLVASFKKLDKPVSFFNKGTFVAPEKT